MLQYFTAMQEVIDNSLILAKFAQAREMARASNRVFMNNSDLANVQALFTYI